MRLLSLFLATLLGCATLPPPPFSIETPHGRVRADDEKTARHVAEALAIAPHVREMLGSPRSKRPEVWVIAEQELGPRGVFASCSDRLILLYRAALEHASYYVAHELVHWYAHDTPYRQLPVFVEEGLADYVALRLLGAHHARAYEHRRLGGVRFPLGVLYATRDTWKDWPLEDSVSATRLGFEAVSKLGLEGVLEYQRRGAGPLEYAQVAADLEELSERR